MRHDLHLFLEDLKTELFGLLLTAFADVESNRARNLVEITDLEFFHDAVWIFRRKQGTKVETLLLHAKNVRIDQLGHLLIARLQHNLFLEDRVVVLRNNARNAAFTNE
jgi:hypothetical protein